MYLNQSSDTRFRFLPINMKVCVGTKVDVIIVVNYFIGIYERRNRHRLSTIQWLVIQRYKIEKEPKIYRFISVTFAISYHIT